MKKEPYIINWKYTQVTQSVLMTIQYNENLLIIITKVFVNNIAKRYK